MKHTRALRWSYLDCVHRLYIDCVHTHYAALSNAFSKSTFLSFSCFCATLLHTCLCQRIHWWQLYSCVGPIQKCFSSTDYSDGRNASWLPFRWFTWLLKFKVLKTHVTLEGAQCTVYRIPLHTVLVFILLHREALHCFEGVCSNALQLQEYFWEYFWVNCNSLQLQESVLKDSTSSNALQLREYFWEYFRRILL